MLKADSFAVSFYGWSAADVFVGTFKALGFRLVSHLAFVKNVWGLGRFTRGQHETAYLLAKGRPPAPPRGISDVIEWEREQRHIPSQPEARRGALSAYCRLCAVRRDCAGPVYGKRQHASGGEGFWAKRNRDRGRGAVLPVCRGAAAAAHFVSKADGLTERACPDGQPLRGEVLGPCNGAG